MPHFLRPPHPPLPSEHAPLPGDHRRYFLYQTGAGLGSVALSWLLAQERARAASDTPAGDAPAPLEPRTPHFGARVKACIFLIMEGGPSQIDTYDPKPLLARHHGSLFQREDVRSAQYRGKRYFVGSPFHFRRRGRCGMDVSELCEETGAHVDDMAFVRSLYADSDNHPAALFHYTTGLPVQGNPSLGAWATYGLGTENQNLPAFVVLRDGRPFGGTTAWGSGYLPSFYQGTQLRSGKNPVVDLALPEGVSREAMRHNLDLLGKLNRVHSRRQPHHPDLEARIAAYELAFRMQSEVPEAVDVGREPERVRARYGLDQDKTKSFGQRCLLARRLVERGVRFVQVWSGGWDSHRNLNSGHRHAAGRVDRPIAGLLADLKERGLLDETLVVWGGEFGRTPDCTEANANAGTHGRDHNPGAMTVWLAGGGVRGGSVVGATDELGNAAAENRYHLRDLHATILHLFGLDQFELTYYHGGRFKRLTDNGGRLIREVLA